MTDRQMYTNSYVVSSLPAYVEQNKEIISRELVAASPSVARFTHQRVKNKAYLNFLSVDAPFVTGKGCDFSPNGTGTFSYRTIETEILRKDLKFCSDDLLGYWPEYEANIPADKRDNFPFEAYIVAELVVATADQLEKLVWQGDKTSSDATLSKMNGLLKILAGEATAITESISSGASAYDGIKQVIKKIPAAVLKKGASISVSPEIFMEFGLELVEKNYYHYSGAQNELPDFFVFPGTNVKVVNTPGLATSLKIVASFDKNFFYGSDDDDAQNRVVCKYDEINDYIAVKLRFNAGVQVAFPDWVVIGTFAAAPVEPAGLANIAASVATIATNSTGIKTDADKIAGAVNSDNQIETHPNE